MARCEKCGRALYPDGPMACACAGSGQQPLAPAPTTPALEQFFADETEHRTAPAEHGQSRDAYYAAQHLLTIADGMDNRTFVAVLQDAAALLMRQAAGKLEQAALDKEASDELGR